MMKILKNLFNNKNNQQENAITNEIKISNSINSMYESLEYPIITIKIGNDIAQKSFVVVYTIEKVRKSINESTGFILPPVRCIETNELQENEVIFLINNTERIQKFLIPNEENIEKEIYSSIEKLFINNINDIFRNEIVEEYIARANCRNTRLIADITFALSTVEIRNILAFLLSNGKSIKNISLIFEKIAECLFINKTQDYKMISLLLLDKV